MALRILRADGIFLAMSLCATKSMPAPRRRAAGPLRGAVLCAAFAALAARPAPAQQVPANLPPPSQAAAALQQAVQRNPGLADVIRSRITQSGMTPDQVRARLQAAGYPSSLLDSYMGAANPNAPSAAPGAQELSAVQALGLPAIAVAVESLPVDTGLVRATQQAAAPEKEDSIFGVSVFRRSTTQFLPLLSGPVPSDYRLGAGDQLVLILTGDVETAYTLSVTREGFVLIPQVGQVFVSGLTLDEVRNLLYTRLGRVYSGVRRGAGATTRFDISVASLGAVQPYVVGEVNQPGAYQISSLGTVLTAIYAAGGVTDRAGVRAIEVRRAGRVVATFDLYDYLLHGNTGNDVRLQTGDVVFVGLHGTRAAVQGAVLRPSIYALTPRETLADLVAAAGGLRADAATQRLSVQRIVPPDQRTPLGAQRVMVDVPLARGADGRVSVPPFPMQDGDVVAADSLPRALHNYVEIRGSVYQPGRYALEAGMRLSRLVQLAGGFRPATYAGRAHIDRLRVSDSTRSVLAVPLPPDSASAWPQDVALQDFDSVTVYGRPEMRDSITVAITGMVNKPGRFPWRAGMTLRDLVLMARGPKVGAYLQEAEIARLPDDRSQGQLATTIRVPMDSTYLFDRDSLGRYVGPPGMAFPASGAASVLIAPYDNVLILRQPNFEFQRTVDIQGEVMYPGTYALRTKGDRLADLVARAGGLSPRAYPEGVRFIRSLNNAGRININLPNALRNHESRDNLVLQPNDSIFVPEYQASVRVIGAVNTPGSVLYRKGKGIGYYIDAAGGGTRLSVEGRASVRQADGEVQTRSRTLLFFRSEPEPGPGSEVYVPARDPTDRTDVVALFASIAQVLASTMAIILVATKL